MATQTYTAKSGDNLFKIAEQIYGDQRKAYEIAQLNGGSFLVRPGDTFRLPARGRAFVTKEAELVAAGLATVNGRNISGLANPPIGQGGTQQQGGVNGYVAPTPQLATMGQQGNPLYGNIPQSAQGITPGGVLQEDVFWTQRGSNPQTAPEGQLATNMGMNVGTQADPRRGRGTNVVDVTQGRYPQVQTPPTNTNIFSPTPGSLGTFANPNQPVYQGVGSTVQQNRNVQPSSYQGRIAEIRAAQQPSDAGNMLNAQLAYGMYPEIIQDNVLSNAMAGIPKDFQAAAMAEAGYTYKDGIWTRTGKGDSSLINNIGQDFTWKQVFPTGWEIPTLQSNVNIPNTRVADVPLNPYYTAGSLNWRVATG